MAEGKTAGLGSGLTVGHAALTVPSGQEKRRRGEETIPSGIVRAIAVGRLGG